MYKLAYMYTDSLRYLREEFNLQEALDKAHDPGFDAFMTAVVYRAQTKFNNHILKMRELSKLPHFTIQ